jgi:uncharacterized protein (DUF433 family)
MATLDWAQCRAVESVPGRLSGAWVFKDTRMPVAAVFENLEVGSNVEEIMEQYDLTREQIQAVLEFAARSLERPGGLPHSQRRGRRLKSLLVDLTTVCNPRHAQVVAQFSN